jgi:hypothetical protein
MNSPPSSQLRSSLLRNSGRFTSPNIAVINPQPLVLEE